MTLKYKPLSHSAKSLSANVNITPTNTAMTTPKSSIGSHGQDHDYQANADKQAALEVIAKAARDAATDEEAKRIAAWQHRNGHLGK